MPENITLRINGALTTLPWSEFVETIDATETSKQLYENLETAFLIQCACLVMLMQAGFLMVEAGSISTRLGLPSIILKNLGDAILGGFFYLAIGFGLSYGAGGPIIGGSGFAVQGAPLCWGNENGGTTCSAKQYALLFYRLTFATSTGTIMSGAVAERMRLPVYYLIISSTISSWIYPLVTRWAWYSNGWASIYRTQDRLFDTGVIDYAGSSVVHMTGALPALILLPLLGPRKHRFRVDAKSVRIPGQNNYFTTLGTMILWMSWYGVVCGTSAVSEVSATQGHVVAKVACNTTMSAVAASLTTIVLGLWYEKRLDASNASNGILSGLVGITGACATVATEAALFIGIVSSLIYFSFSKLMIRVKLDDVVDAVPIHLCCGLWGLVAPALFSKRQFVQVAFPHLKNTTEVPCGILYSCDGLGSKLLAANLVYALSLIAWVGSMTLILVLPLWYFNLLYDAMPQQDNIDLNSADDEKIGDEGQLILDTISERDDDDSNVLSQIQAVYPDVKRLTPSPPVSRNISSAEESRPPSAGESIPPSAGESIPPSAEESSPPSAGESIPPSTGDSIPPSAGESRSPSAGESSPPSAGESIPPDLLM